MKSMIDFEGIERSLPLDADFLVEGLTLLPALIDPHVHFRFPGLTHKEDWKSAANACLQGGVSRVFDMPNTNPPCTSKERLLEKKQKTKEALKEIDVSLSYELYFAANGENLDQLESLRGHCKMLKVFLGASSKDLVLKNEDTLEEIFRLASAFDLVLAVHAESEEILQQRRNRAPDTLRRHFFVHDRSAAIDAVEKVIRYAEQYRTKLYLLHLSTKEELDLVAEAKKRGVLVFAETCPHYLFLTELAFFYMGRFSQVNPPLRTKKDQDALWQAIDDGLIDAIGSDHAPHLCAEKSAFPAASGFPGLETRLPLLLNAYHQKKITLEKIVALCRRNIEEFFALEPASDWVLVDLEQEKMLKNKHLKTKAAWSPFAGRVLKGWPVCSIFQDKVYFLDKRRSRQHHDL